MTAERILELIARRESASPDFKKEHYDWRNDGNLELAKDLMAMANALSPGTGPAYILIGVDVDADQLGVLVGIDPAEHLDDAIMHEKVKQILNRCPQFHYFPVEVDGMSIGVYEIRPGLRPIYPLRSQGNRHRLNRFEARVRLGSSTDVASPDQIQSWWREDEPEAAELRRAELEVKEAQLVVKSAATLTSASFSRDTDTGTDVIYHSVAVQNLAECRFTITNVRQTWFLTEKFFEAQTDRVIGRPGMDLIVDETPSPAAIGAGETAELAVSLSALQVYTYLNEQLGLAIASTSWYEWVDGSVSIECKGVTGRSCVATIAFDMHKLLDDIQVARQREAEQRRKAFAAKRGA